MSVDAGRGQDVRVVVVEWDEAKRLGAGRLRHDVFVAEMRIVSSETDEEGDAKCVHALAFVGGEELAGTGRLFRETGHVGRMAVLRQHRSRGIGALLLNSLVDKARSMGMAEVALNAQVPAEKFYLRNGFERTSDVYAIPGVDMPHVDMRKRLASVYLDYNATTPLCSSAITAMQKGLTELWGNPGSAGAAGDAARDAVAAAKQEVALLLQCDAQHLVVTSGGTESNNTALRSVLEGRSIARCITSSFEHPAIEEVLKALPNVAVVRVPVDRRGQLDREAFVAALKEGADLVTVMWANNEVGAINDVAELCRLTRLHCPSALFHTDAAQAVGKTTVSVGDVHMMTVVAHKFYGPKSVGILYSRVPLRPLLLGGSQQGGRRAGTESALLCRGLGAAARHVRLAAESGGARHLEQMRNLLWELLQDAFPRAVKWNDIDARLSLSNTLSVCLDPSGIPASDIVSECAKHGLGLSAGAACHRGSMRPSQTMTAIGVPPDLAIRTLRLSTGLDTTERDVRDAVKVLASVLRK